MTLTRFTSFLSSIASYQVEKCTSNVSSSYVYHHCHKMMKEHRAYDIEKLEIYVNKVLHVLVDRTYPL